MWYWVTKIWNAQVCEAVPLRDTTPDGKKKKIKSEVLSVCCVSSGV